MLSIILAVVFAALMILRVPIAIVTGVSTLFVLILGDYPLLVLGQFLSTGIQKYSLLAIPFFIFAGNLMNETGISKRIFDFAMTLVGHIKGGLGHVNVLASMIFAGISGAAVADAMGLGVVEIREMTARGYDKSFSCAITLASSIIGPIIPPSIGFVVYAVLTDVSIARLFLAGCIPGVLVGLSLMVIIYYFAATGKQYCPLEPRKSPKQIVISFRDGFLALIAPLIILGGMVTGFATPTEAGVVATFYSIFVGLVYRELKWQGIKNSLMKTCTSCGTISFILANAYVLSWFLTTERTAVVLQEAIMSLTQNKYLILLLLNIFLLLLGCVLEGIPAKIIVVPILLPLLNEVGIDLIHFGVIITLNLLIGYTTPPIGVGLFAITSISDIKFEELVKSMLPFYIPLVICLFVVTYIEPLTMWLPNLLMPR